jgi:2-polyprenyl-3-methyl-5-hydroxy-6-metoxy-1,4-benzoquinol methylase
MTERSVSSGQAYSEQQAKGYEEDPEHTLFPAEQRVWIDAINDLGLPPDSRILDFGAGTGALLAMLKNRRLHALGLEPSAPMIEQALLLHPELEATDFKRGDAGAMESDGELFDLIVSRQVLCHIEQPAHDFGRLHSLLKPGGSLMLVDGFWPAKSWSPEQLFALPFAALTSADPVADLLVTIGFDVLEARLFNDLNTARREALPGSKDRYIVVARRQ